MIRPYKHGMAIGILVLAAVVSYLEAEVSERPPFADLARELKARGGWAGDKRQMKRLFEAEKNRLGARFRDHVVKFVGKDPERHFWIASFLRRAQKPEDDMFALLLLEQGAVLCRRDVDNKDKFASETYSIAYCAAVLSAEMGLTHLASSHKATAEKLLRNNPLLAGATPAMSKERHDMYDAIPLKKTLEK